jgi:DNA-binding NtrC family response regulator
LVEDDPILRATLRRQITAWGFHVVPCATGAQAIAALESPVVDYVLTDIFLPDTNGIEIVRAALARWPLPHVVACSGGGAMRHGFELGELGARAFLEKPFGTEELRRALSSASSPPPLFDVAVRTHVGRTDLDAILRRVRHVILREALALSRGNRTEAARMLNVTRQAIQYMLRADYLEPEPERARDEGGPDD